MMKQIFFFRYIFFSFQEKGQTELNSDNTENNQKEATGAPSYSPQVAGLGPWDLVGHNLNKECGTDD